MNKRAKEIVADLNKKFAPLIKQADQDEQLGLNSGPWDPKKEVSVGDKYPGVDSMGEPMADFLFDPPSDAHGYGFPGTLSDEEVQARDALPPAGVNMDPNADPRGGGDLVGVDSAPPVDDSLMARIMKHLSDNKGKYALGAGAAGVGALGAGLMMGGNEEDEEDEDRQRV
jgi:hypothetical protein